MNTETFCVEFEKIFGQYKSKRIKRCQRILSDSQTMISLPYLNFLYQASLYFKIRVSEVKTLFDNNCGELHSLCDEVYKRFRRTFRKNTVERADLLPIYLEKIYTSVSRGTDMLDQILKGLLIESRMILEFLFYETTVLTSHFSISPKNKKRQREIICIKTKDLL